MNKYTGLLLLTLLNGCGAVYILPDPSEKVAYLNFAVEADTAIGFNSAISVLTDPHNGYCGQYRPVAQIHEKQPLMSTVNPENIPIRAGREIGIRSGIAPIGYFGRVGCSYVTIFTPVEGSIYRIKLELDEKICRSTLEVKVEGRDWVAPEEPFDVKQIRC
jgi:hypothetical protein